MLRLSSNYVVESGVSDKRARLSHRPTRATILPLVSIRRTESPPENWLVREDRAPPVAFGLTDHSPHRPAGRHDQARLKCVLAVMVLLSLAIVACGPEETAAPAIAVGPTETAVPPTATLTPPTVAPPPTSMPKPSPTLIPPPTATPAQLTPTPTRELPIVPTSEPTVEVAPATPPAIMPTETPTAVPSPTALPAAEPTVPPTPGPPPTATHTPLSVVSAPTPSIALADQVFRILQQLTEEYSPRERASEQELEAAHHLLGRLSDLGYETSLQEFSVTLKRARVKLESTSQAIPEAPRGRALIDSPHETATGQLTYVGRAYEEDIPDEGLDGRIALIARGDITFEEKINRVAQAGAVGAIILNNRKSKFYDWYAVNPRIPVVAISQADGRVLQDLVERGDLEATVSVGMEELPSQNVIADVPSASSTDRTVIIGAHYDTVVSTQGASDNGSGVSAVLVMADHISSTLYIQAA